MASPEQKRVHATLNAILPIHSGSRSLLARSAPTVDATGVWVHLELSGTNQEESPEGRICLAPPQSLADADRLEAYLRGWADAVGEVLDSASAETLATISITSLAHREILGWKRLRAREDFRRAMLDARALGRFMPLPTARDGKGRRVVDAAREVLAEVLPVTAGAASLQAGLYADADPWQRAVFERPGIGTYATLQLITWEVSRAGDQEVERSIRDIREQEVALIPLEGYEDPDRVEPFLRGLAAALEEVFEQAPLETLETLMPHELVDSRVIGLKRARSAEDYKAALLAPSRLGKVRRKP